jgi:tetratricopeptide (TPR) repeat protein
LLPRSTFAYIFTKLDAKAAWDEWATPLFNADDRRAFAAIWALDVAQEVLPELGPECGIALLGLPSFDTDGLRSSLVFFCKLKSDRLARAFTEGKLFKQVAATTDAARVKFGSNEMFVTVKNGFLIFAGEAATLKKLDAPEKLDVARDFARAAKRAPDRLIAFGGYNLEAAIAEINVPTDDPAMKQFAGVLTSLARAFHSQNFYATATQASVNARMSISLDREGRYSVAELSSLIQDYRLSFAVIEARGVAILDQQRLESLKLRLRAQATGEIDRLKEDLTLANQNVEKRSEGELIVSVLPRHTAPVDKIQLPITGAEFAPYLRPTHEIRSDDKSVIQQAREIAGNDREAWSVARKLADWTYKNLKWKRVDVADAAQTLATREADCSEFSQLFVAMARALGLPARMVSGIAYGDGSFGGHAWVEVYAGRWIELDPTWGTDFVDATHVRSAGSDLLNYAALNLVTIDVLEAPHAVADYQREATALAAKLCAEIGKPRQPVLAAVLDMTALADEHIGAGAWAQMSEREREQWLAVQPKLTAYLSRVFATLPEDARVLKVNQKGERAEVLLLVDDVLDESLVKLSLARRGEAWILMDVTYTVADLHLAAEKLRPTVQAMLARRAGKPSATALYSESERVMLLLNVNDAKGAFEVVEPALAAQPGSRVYRHLKALCLVQLERVDEAVKLWTELSREAQPMAGAVYALASHYESAEDAAGKQRAVELFKQYAALEPDDPRPHTSLAVLYEEMSDSARAETEYRAAVACDPRSHSRWVELAMMLVQSKRYDAALAAIDEGTKQSGTSEDLLAWLILRLGMADHGEAAEALAAAHPERLAKSAEANLNLANLRIGAGRLQAALPLLQKALELKKDSVEAHTAKAEVYRHLHNWAAALQAADAAIRIDEANAAAHYHRACALARLGRATAAMAALKQAIELDEDMADNIAEEEDLQSLKRLPEFKKLLPKEESDK